MVQASWGISWAMLARIFDFSVQFWTCWRQNGGEEGQDDDQEAQDGRTDAKMGFQIHATNFGVIRLMRARGVWAHKRLELLVDLMHRIETSLHAEWPSARWRIYIYIYR